MWILTNSKDLLEYMIQSRFLSSCNRFKNLTSLPSTQLFLTLSEGQIKGVGPTLFHKKNGQCRYKYLVLGRDISIKQFSETNIINMLEFYWQHIYPWWTFFSTDSRHTYGYKLCSSFGRLVPLFVWGRRHTGASQEKYKKKLARSFNFTLRYIDDVLSLNNSRCGDFVDRIYPIELEIKDTTDTDRSASCLDLHLEIDSEWRLRTQHYDKRDDFNILIVNFPFICSNIPAAPAYEVYISQLIRYSRACGSHQDVLDRGLLLTRKLLNQGFPWLSWSHHFECFTVATMTWLTIMEYRCHKRPRICSTCRKYLLVFSLWWLVTGFVTKLTRRVPLVVEQELLTLPKHLSSPPVFSGVRVTRSLVLCVCFVDRCLAFCTLFLAIVLSVLLRFTDSDYLPLVSSNSSLSKKGLKMH